MKVVYDPQIFCLQIYGGVSRYFCEVASIIANSKLAQVSVVAPFNVCEYLANVPNGIVYGFRAPRLQPLKNIQRLAGIALGHLYLLVLRPEIIHETYFFPYPMGPRNSKRVLTIYDMIHEKFPEVMSPGDRTAEYKAKAVARADHIICISEATKRDLVNILGVNPAKITVIYLGHELRKANDSQGLKVATPFLLYVGQRNYHKNFKLFVRAFTKSNKLAKTFKIICFGGGEFTDEEKSFFNSLGLFDDQLQHISGADEMLTSLYGMAAAFIYPSLYEGFGIPPLEAMANNCPVICSNAGSIPEVVGSAGEYFDPNDADSMIEAIEKVVFDSTRASELIENGKKQVNVFSWDECANKTFGVYKNLMKHE